MGITGFNLQGILEELRKLQMIDPMGPSPQPDWISRLGSAWHGCDPRYILLCDLGSILNSGDEAEAAIAEEELLKILTDSPNSVVSRSRHHGTYAPNNHLQHQSIAYTELKHNFGRLKNAHAVGAALQAFFTKNPRAAIECDDRVQARWFREMENE